MDAKTYVQSYIDRARTAQKQFETFSQEQVDLAVRAIGKSVYDNAEELARMAVDETRMGVYEDKIAKNKGKSKAVWSKIKGVKSRGIIRYLDNLGLVEVAKPIGVIGSVGPTTNPTITPMQNAMCAVKGGNAMIVCPHPRAKNTSAKTIAYIRQALEDAGAPQDLVQIIPEPTMEISSLVMSMCDICISTGGMGMVHAAFSSGKPAYGVGAGNVQSIIDRDVDLRDVAAKLVQSRTYDNGILCTCEQSAICPAEKYDEFISLMKEQHVHYVEADAEVAALRDIMFPGGMISKNIVGAAPGYIASLAGITVPEGTKMLLVKAEKFGRDELLAKEKMCPVMTAFRYDSWETAVDIANENLLVEGTGHSVVLHSNNKEHIEYAAVRLPVSRFAVNQVGSSSLGGTFLNGLNPTATLGCGSWGNNSTTDNLWWDHLVNISRIIYEIPGKAIPSDEEIWAM